MGRFQETGWLTNSLFITMMILVGLAEEFSFRGLVLPLFIRKFVQLDDKSAITRAVIYSSVLFGIIHFLNLTSQPDNFSGVASQVLFAIPIGVFLAGVMLRTGSIIFTSLIHALFNILFASRSVTGTELSQTAGTDLLSLTITLSIFAALFYFSLRMLRKVSVEDLNLKE